MAEIFVVDDSVSVRKALEMALRSKGIGTRNAISAEDALNKLDDEPFEVMITDIIMPGMSGFELCRQVKSNPKYAHIPVLLISGNVDDEVRQEAQQVGAEEILRKPFRPDELLPVIEKFLELSRERKQALSFNTNIKFEEESATVLSEPAQNLVSPITTHQSVATAFYDANGDLWQSEGVALPEVALTYAKFYLNTAQVLGGQLGSGSINNIHLDFEDQVILFSFVDNRIKIEVLIKS